MPAWMNPGPHLGALMGSVGRFQLIEVEDPTPPKYLTNWLARLRLLYGVPFSYLVPNAALLPPESIRFFYVDRNWTDRLVDGALSVGKTTTLEYAQYQAVSSTVAAAVDTEERAVRGRLRSEQLSAARDASAGTVAAAAPPSGSAGVTTTGTPATAPAAPQLAGFLFRSAVVSGWPGLEVKAMKGTTPVEIVRMDRLAPNTLLCIFADTPTRVSIEGPRESARFGVDLVAASGTTPSGFELQLRQLHGANAGAAVASRKVAIPVRKGNRRVLHIGGLRAMAEVELKKDPGVLLDPAAPAGTGSISSAELAVQMLQLPFVQVFEGAAAAPTGVVSGVVAPAPISIQPQLLTAQPSAVAPPETMRVAIPVRELATPLQPTELQDLLSPRQPSDGRIGQ